MYRELSNGIITIAHASVRLHLSSACYGGKVVDILCEYGHYDIPESSFSKRACINVTLLRQAA